MYFNNFHDKQDIIRNFEIQESTLDDANIKFASYGGMSYEGDAIVILTRGDKVYEVHGSHCSCYGLEEQWDEEETTWEALHDRYVVKRCDDEYFREEHSSAAADFLKDTIMYEFVEKHLLGEE